MAPLIPHTVVRALAEGLASRIIGLIVAACLFTPTAWSQSEAERALESRVKAAFLYRFTEFVTWPGTAFERADSPFVIAVMGHDALADELRNVTRGRTVAGRAVEVRRPGDPGAAPAAHLLFIGDAERARLRDLVRSAPRHALVVTESPGALADGSVVNFLLVDGRVRFEIALDAAERRGLRLSSRLLGVAHAVHTGSR